MADGCLVSDFVERQGFNLDSLQTIRDSRAMIHSTDSSNASVFLRQLQSRQCVTPALTASTPLVWARVSAAHPGQCERSRNLGKWGNASSMEDAPTKGTSCNRITTLNRREDLPLHELVFV